MRNVAKILALILLILFISATSAPAAKPAPAAKRAPILVCVGVFTNVGKQDIWTNWLSLSFTDYATLALHAVDGVWATKPTKLADTVKNLNLVGKGDEASLSKIAEALQVRYLISGAYRVTPGKVEVALSCYDAKNKKNSSPVEFSGTLGDVFRLHELVTTRIAGMLGIKPTDPRLKAGLLKAQSDWSPYGYFAHGAYQLIMGNDDAGISDLESAIGYGCRISDVYAMLGMGYQRKLDFKKAVELYTKAVEVNPSCAAAYAGRASSYCGLKDYEKALADASLALVLDPKNTAMLTSRGMCYVLTDRPDLAIDDYNKALLIDPTSPLVYCYRSQAYMKKKDYDQAMADCNKAISLNPNYSIAYSSRAQCQSRLKGDYDAALADLDTCIGLDGKDGYALRGRGCCYCCKHDYARAIADLARAIDLYPDYAEGYGIRAWIYTEKGDYASATADCEKALSLDSKCLDAFCSRANIEFHKGDYDAAIADANKSIAIDAKDDWSYLVLARVGLAKKDYDLAWKNVKLCRDNFGHPEESFIKDLEAASGRTE